MFDALLRPRFSGRPPTSRFYVIFVTLLLTIVLIVGCDDAAAPAAPLVATATPPAVPTPTLSADITALPNEAPPTTAAEADAPGAVNATDPSAPSQADGSQTNANDSASEDEVTQAEQLLEADAPAAGQPDRVIAVPTIDPSLSAAELQPLAERAFAVGDYAQSAAAYQAILAADPAADNALLGLGQAQMALAQPAAAVETLTRYLAQAAEPDSRAYFWLAQVENDPQAAAAHYAAYRDANPEMAVYVEQRLAALLPAAAEEHLLAALDSDADAHYLVLVALHQQLADLYLEQERYLEAIAQYTAIRDMARTEFTRGEMTYLIGQAYLLAGDEESALAAYNFALDNYPTAYTTYQGLVALVEAGRTVDDYQRGIVDYYAKAYAPAVEALNSYIATTDPVRADAYLFLAWSYEGLGAAGDGLTALDQYLALDPTNPEVIGRHIDEKAALLTRSVSTQQAIDELQAFAGRAPDHPLVPWALYRSGVLADRFRLEPEQAIPLYDRFVTAYPAHPQASEALFRNGMMSYELGQLEQAAAYWGRAADYTDEFGRAALVWRIRTADPETAAALKEQAAAASGSDYYSIRAQDIGRDLPAYPPAAGIQIEFDEAAAQAEVEGWIKAHFGLGEDAVVTSTLDPAIAEDPRLIRGEKLWRLGLKAEAKQELEAIREQYAENAQLSYQLALYFRDLGLYRSSILAADAVLIRARVSVFDAPSLIGRLAYPIYYSDLLLPQAERYGYDPLLQFAQIRQESLFESFIASVAAAQGLSQIIPDTGQYIATRLNWPDYQVSDLNRQYINVIFGSYYLDQQLDLFEGSIAPALAAYNAGPGNAIRWFEAAGDDHDLYLETVNFAETRLYIRRIYVGHAVYKHLYEQDAN